MTDGPVTAPHTLSPADAIANRRSRSPPLDRPRQISVLPATDDMQTEGPTTVYWHCNLHGYARWFSALPGNVIKSRHSVHSNIHITNNKDNTIYATRENIE